MRAQVFGFVVATALLAVSFNAQAQDAPPGSATLDIWQGEWTSAGSLQGAEMTGTLSWSWELGGWFMYGVEVQNLQTEAGLVTMETHHVLRPMGDGTYMTSSMNSMGEIAHGTATDTETGVVFAVEQSGMSLTYDVVMADGPSAVSTISLIGEDGAPMPVGVITYTSTAVPE